MLRAATAKDSEQVAHVILSSRRAYLPFAPIAHPENEVKVWVAEILIPAGQVMVVEVAEQVVGVLATSSDTASSWIEQLYVLPGFTNQGIGTRLLTHAQSVLKEPIRLYTFQANDGARRFYERHGYHAKTFSSGENNEEGCPDVLYERGA